MKHFHGWYEKQREAQMWVTRRDFVVGAFVAGGLPGGLRRASGNEQGAPARAQSAQILVFDTFGTVVD